MIVQQHLDFGSEHLPVTTAQIKLPGGYKGLYAFHKYWGKKPHETIAYIIEQLSAPHEVVLDPFVGSGSTGREALLRRRRFIGFDINPVAVELTRLLLRPPSFPTLKEGVECVAGFAKDRILESYLLRDRMAVASHYLWNNDRLTEVWVQAEGGKRKRSEHPPTQHDISLFESFQHYKSQRLRQPYFFDNSRINATRTMTLDDLLTGRAQRNIDLLLDAIVKCPIEAVPALKLCVTAASGQMSKMVFAVTERGKTTGKSSQRVEVGSWVIGYWRPRLHFEVNVWNCFNIRARKLLKAVKDGDPLRATRFGDSPDDVLQDRAQAHIACGDCRRLFATIPDRSVHLLVTDPPHGDRIPYLELSEFWNSILNLPAQFEDELVFTNAKCREKSSSAFAADLQDFLGRVPRVLAPDAFLVILFNARHAQQWSAFHDLFSTRAALASTLNYLGSFPCDYSTGSVVQDNRQGSLRSDYALVFSRSQCDQTLKRRTQGLRHIPGWTEQVPAQLFSRRTHGFRSSRKTIPR